MMYDLQAPTSIYYIEALKKLQSKFEGKRRKVSRIYDKIQQIFTVLFHIDIL